MTDVTATARVKRPAAITAVCVLGAIGLLGLGYLVSSGALAGLPDWYVIFLAISVAANIIAMVGMFMMRKWGAYLYAGVFVLTQLVLVVSGFWAIQTFIVPVIVTAVAMSNAGKMR